MKTEVDSIMQNTVERNLLKWAAGQAICCPGCGEIMDWKRTVIASVHASKDGGPEHEVKTYVQCADCFDKNRHHIDNAFASLAEKRPDIVCRLETVDGREKRFGKGKR